MDRADSLDRAPVLEYAAASLCLLGMRWGYRRQANRVEQGMETVMIRVVVGCMALITLTGSGAAEGKGKPEDRTLGLRPRVVLETAYGDITLELDAEKAPVSVMRFIQYVEDGFYDGTIFHRVIRDFAIQGGLYKTDMLNRPGALRGPIVNEWKNGLSNERGTVAMARLAGMPNGSDSEFFINVADNNFLDLPQRDGAGYAVFGRVVEGMRAVDEISEVDVGPDVRFQKGKEPVVPTMPIVLQSARVIRDFDRKNVAATIKALETKAEKHRGEVRQRAEREIAAYVAKLEAETGRTVVKTASGLRYMVLQEGTGRRADIKEQVRVRCEGRLLDGTSFYSTRTSGPAVFSVKSVMKGWTEALELMRVNAKWKLILPPELGYGNAGRPKIPPDSVLVFDVELLAIKPGSGF